MNPAVWNFVLAPICGAALLVCVLVAAHLTRNQVQRVLPGRKRKRR